MLFLVDPNKPTKEVCTTLTGCTYFCKIKPLYGIDW